MPTISTRRAEVTDAATVARFVHALLDELSGGKAPGIETVRQSAETVLADVSVVAVIACADNEPVGVMVLNECTAIYAGGKFGEISELYVRPNIRSQGIAPHLIAVALAEGRARGWKRLEVGAPGQPRWKRTLDFYLRNGFEEVGPRLRRMI
ncbi:GNAT family N-acetyltransferase [Bradyrhizobium sp. 200]|uniref:GNAT family N-acetyltransferase n=1 Tax=Bradyrhizobium sp. 200 TaxID=2782665 RepID=UPI001FFF3C12|nr:GNAT family N-acetyltransferase [Bradyrhizobium sp. 200]UPJ47999.1 GNAT family N-acetyltransferase [Bradyrhizobium sp. 200]